MLELVVLVIKICIIGAKSDCTEVDTIFGHMSVEKSNDTLPDKCLINDKLFVLRYDSGEVMATWCVLKDPVQKVIEVLVQTRVS